MKFLTLLAVPVLAVALAAPAHADVFTMCPDNREGIVGGHTSCAFAENVRKSFYLLGMPTNFVAYSPYTGNSYDVMCDSHMTTASFVTGEVLRSVRCFAGDDAEVVIW